MNKGKNIKPGGGEGKGKFESGIKSVGILR